MKGGRSTSHITTPNAGHQIGSSGPTPDSTAGEQSLGESQLFDRNNPDGGLSALNELATPPLRPGKQKHKQAESVDPSKTERAVNVPVTKKFADKGVLIGSGAYGAALVYRATTFRAERGLPARDIHVVNRSVEKVEALNRDSRFPMLNNCNVPGNVRGYGMDAMNMAVLDRGTFIIGTSAQGIREVANRFAPHPDSHGIIVSKGFVFPDGFSFKSYDDYVKGPPADTEVQLPMNYLESLPHWKGVKLAFFQAAGFAQDIVDGAGFLGTAAARDQETARHAIQFLKSPGAILSPSLDPEALQFASAAKNVAAIAVAILNGLERGGHTTRSLRSEVASVFSMAVIEGHRLARAYGFNFNANPKRRSQMGAPMADYVLSCGNEQSRNNRLGFELGERNKTGDLPSVLEALNREYREAGKGDFTAEGLANAWALKLLGDRLHPRSKSDYGKVLYLPITNAVVDILGGDRPTRLLEAIYDFEEFDNADLTMDEFDPTKPVWIHPEALSAA